MQVCVVGLGTVGLPTAMYIQERGFKTVGFDIDPRAAKRASDAGLHSATTWSDTPDCDLYVVCVSTTYTDNRPDMSAVRTVASSLAKRLNHGSVLISIESTVTPGTCRSVYQEILKGRALLTHVPHRYWAGDPEGHGVKQLRIIGAIGDESMDRAFEFYSKNLDIPLHRVASIEEAEMAKVAENAFRYVQIAFAEELKMLCDDLHIDFQKVREASNTKWNTEIPEARTGIGGHCLPKDVRYLRYLARNAALLDGAITVNDEYVESLNRKSHEST